MKAPLPPEEPARLASLRSYAILDTDAEAEFDDLALLATHICGTPIGFITMLDENRQWFKSKIGTTLAETPRDIAFCAHGILEPEVFVVPDARADPRFADNPLLNSSPNIRFYAGAPLRTAEGHALGMLCVTDQVPRELTAEQKSALQVLGRQVVARLELRKTVRELRNTVAELESAKKELLFKNAFFVAQTNSTLDGILVVDPQNQKLLQNQNMSDLFNIPPSIAANPEDTAQLQWVADMVKNAAQFIEKVVYLYTHPLESSQDEIQLKNGKVLDRYSSPVIGADKTCHGRIWTFRDITERKRAEEELQRQKNELRVLFDYIPAILCFKDTKNRIVRANSRLAESLGRSIEELEGRPTSEIFPDESAKFFADDLEVISSGVPKLGIIESFRAAGKRLWLQTDKVPVRDNDGKVIGLIVMSQDLTQSKLAENQLRESEEKFRQLAENITDVFWITSPDFKTVEYVSPAYSLIWGRSPENLRARPRDWMDAIVPEDRERVLAAFARLQEEGPSVSVEYRISRPDGAVRWLHDRRFAIRDAEGKLVRLTGIAADITERRQSEYMFRLLSTAVDQSKESILITDAQLDLPGPKIVFVNPAFTKLTGYSQAESIGATPRRLQGPRTDKAVLRRLRQNLERGEAFAGEAINYRKDGSEFHLEWQVNPIRDEEARTTHYIAFQRDITERKRLEAQLVQSQKMETVGKLAGGIAHEFNSILTAIIGQGELLLSDLPGGSALSKNAAQIIQAANRAAALTRQLLAYGRKQLLQPEILDLNQVIQEISGILRNLLGSTVEVKVFPALHLHRVRADATQIEQVIMNLTLNARDAMPKGGKLTLETANVTFAAEGVNRHPDPLPGDYVMLAITDTGVGIPPEAKPRLFEPFFTTKEVGEGTGLGLSTCYGIIKQSGGHISVYSEMGRGTTFKVYLPQVTGPAEKPPLATGSAGDLPTGNETVLLVEDDPALLEMAATLLRRLGYRVYTAANGLDALNLKNGPDTGFIDILFTDVVMPHMSGKELSERITAISPRTRILYTSAYTENSMLHQGGLQRGNALLPKPFTPSALARKLREVLDQPGAEA